MNIQVGDIVHVRGTVFSADSKGCHYTLCHGCTSYCTFDDIVCVEPRPLQVGDRVQAKAKGAFSFSETAEIKAVDGLDAWVGWSDKSHGTYRLSDLERAP